MTEKTGGAALGCNFCACQNTKMPDAEWERTSLPMKNRSASGTRFVHDGEKMKDAAGTSMAGLRSAGLIAVVFGSVASIGLLRHAQEHPPPIVVAGFVAWVLAPFIVLGVANFRSKRWSRRNQIALHVVTFVITVASLAIYLDDNIAHRTAKRAFVYVAVPPAAVILIGVALAFAFWQARKESHE